ncbi:MAG: hypothetical protein ACI867_001534, partial [Glaciecola sp.]
MELSHKAQRVLGTLVEKAMTKPDGYPLPASLLRTACNQKTGRDPIVLYSDQDVTEGIRDLREHHLILTKHQPGSRSPKFAHMLRETLDLKDAQIAALGILLLRGAQTVGEVKGRTGRMHPYASIEEVEEVLQGLIDHKFHGAIVERLPPQPGQKEERWRHVLGPAAIPTAEAPADDTELQALRTEVAELRERNATLMTEITELHA